MAAWQHVIQSIPSDLTRDDLKAVEAILGDITLRPQDGRGLDNLVAVLNTADLGFEMKHHAMRILAELAATPEHVPVIQTALECLTTAFEAVLKLITGPESRVVCSELQTETLALLYRITDFSLTAADLLELAGTVPNAVHSLTAVFYSSSATREIQTAATDTMMKLTLPDTYFAEDSKCTDVTDLEALTATYNEQVTKVMTASMDQELFTSLIEMYRRWMSSGEETALLHGAMQNTLKFVVNLLNYSSANGKRFRTHLAMDTDFITDVVLPFALLTAEALAATPDPTYSRSMRLALSVLVVATFKLKTLRPVMREQAFIAKMMAVKGALQDPIILALLIKLAINIDFAIPSSTTPRRVSREERMRAMAADSEDRLPSDTQLDPASAAIVQQFRAITRRMGADDFAALRRRMSAIDPAAPVSRACRSYEILSFTVDTLHFDIDKASDCTSLLQLDLPSLPAAGEGEESGDEGEEGEVLVQETPRLGRSALSMLSDWQAGRESKSRSRSPASAGDGSGSAAPRSSRREEAGEAAAPHSHRGGKDDDEEEGDSPGAGAGSGETKMSSGSSHATSSAPARPSQQLPSVSMFSAKAPHHLPPMASLAAPKKKSSRASGDKRKKKKKKKRAKREVPVPSSHVCQLSKAMMEEPVVSPEGIHFDKAAITTYLATHDMCPVTGKPLAVHQLEPAGELKKEIQLFQFRRLMLANKA